MSRTKFLTAAFLLLALAGCANPPAAAVSLSQADEKFAALCRDEMKYPVVIKRAPNTVWIYLPMEENIFDFKASPKGPKMSTQATEGFAIQYLDVNFAEEKFLVQYDINKIKKYTKDLGYASNYSGKYQEKQRNLLTTIFRAYADVPTEQVPPFFVLVIADITKGLETTTIFNFGDFKRAMSDQSFYEEFTRRTVSDEPKGNTNIIGDTDGRHLEITEVTWPEFLSKQIQYRIRMKYQYSSFPPGPNTPQEIADIAAAVTGAYNFTDYSVIVLEDLDAGTKTTVGR